MTVKTLIRVCSVKPSTGKTCYFTVCPSEVPKCALPGALSPISSLQECKVSECPCLRSFLAFAIQEPLTHPNDVGWLYTVDCYSLGSWGEAVKDFLRTVGCTILAVEVFKVNGSFCLQAKHSGPGGRSWLLLQQHHKVTANNRLKITVKIPFTKQGLSHLLGEQLRGGKHTQEKMAQFCYLTSIHW